MTTPPELTVKRGQPWSKTSVTKQHPNHSGVRVIAGGVIAAYLYKIDTID